jgi:hypothetical protein
MRGDYCENDTEMRTCPRYQQYHDYLEATQTKETKGKSIAHSMENKPKSS